MITNENKLRLQGVANLSDELKLGETYDLTISNAEVRKSEDIPNDDGTLNRIFKLTISELSEVFIIGKGTIIKAKKKGSQSQKQRMLLIKLADKYGVDREEYYQKRMLKNIESLQNELNT